MRRKNPQLIRCGSKRECLAEKMNTRTVATLQFRKSNGGGASWGLRGVPFTNRLLSVVPVVAAIRAIRGRRGQTAPSKLAGRASAALCRKRVAGPRRAQTSAENLAT